MTDSDERYLRCMVEHPQVWGLGPTDVLSIRVVLDRLEFYRDRCVLLQKINHKCPEPFRTTLCNVLANGTEDSGV